MIEPTKSGRSKTEPHSIDSERHCRECDLIFDGLTAALLIVAPLFMGGRHPVGRLVYVAGVAALALVWLLRSVRLRQFRYRACGLEWVMLLASGFVLLQLCPLPPHWLERLSPRIAHYLPLWYATPSFQWPPLSWRTLSLTPADTRIGLTVWSAHVLLLLLWVQRLETQCDLRRMVKCVAISGIVLALIGMLQYLFSNGKFLWMYQDPYRDTRQVVRGPFYNENHFAHLLALTLVPLWVWLRSRRAEQRATRERFTLRRERSGELLTAMLAAAWPWVLFTILLTRSRGGLIATLVAVVLGSLGIVARDGPRRAQALRLGGVVAILLAALTIHGFDQVGREVESLTTTSLDQLDERGGRRKIWRAARDVLGQFTLCGAGVGSFRETFPLFYAEPRQTDYSYAESGVLQVAVETGLFGTALLIAGVCFAARIEWAFWRRLRSDANAEWALAAAVGIGVSLVHSVFEFVWYLPACFAMTLALLAVLIRFETLSFTTGSYTTGTTFGRTRTNRLLGAGALVITSALLLTGIGPLLSAARASNPWNAYLLASRQIFDAAGEMPVDPDEESLLQLRRLLLDTVSQQPSHARAHLRLARHSLQLFELRQMRSDNPMSLAQIRDAALASRFESLAAQDRWLKAAVGANRQLLDEALNHAQKALELSPLQGVGYAYLAELAFLRSPGASVHANWVQQALRVRPYDPAVLFAAGREAIFLGDAPGAIAFWRRAYHQDHELRQRITLQLAPQLPAEVFVAQFQPDPSQLLALVDFYRQQAMAHQASVAGDAFLDQLVGGAVNRTQSGEHEAQLWRQGYTIAAELNDARRIAIAQRAVALNPHDYTMRRRLALELLGQQAWRPAIEHLSWCRDKMPADRGVAEKLRWARQQLALVDDPAQRR